ncbi:methylthioribulose-1-phosphate dehydratase [Seinonella peptonophila]|uniref:Methylthioribulose-1-phosphate dehydratase n=1 Tax=Seinonella peptonophila TaxID=112248 RepID=A0A1M4Z8K5_9BACL|nr:methylthioribulose 1-phosphate dehydratase [Seinonella peptonophila]SHF14393.1 methylthioribulose-1-phosphate dehydratase [Seinonella peptonophila]
MILIENYWDQLADVKDELASRGWFPGTSGNLSIKVDENPRRFLVTASGIDKTKRTEEDFILVDQQGQPVYQTELRVSAETSLHCQVYEQTDAGCCLHIHTVDNNVISELYAEQGYITFRNQELIKAFGIWDQDGEITLPIIENHANMELLTQAFAQAISAESYGVLIRNHGITVWGKDAFTAKKHLEAFEFLCSYELKLRQFA